MRRRTRARVRPREERADGIVDEVQKKAALRHAVAGGVESAQGFDGLLEEDNHTLVARVGRIEPARYPVDLINQRGSLLIPPQNELLQIIKPTVSGTTCLFYTSNGQMGPPGPLQTAMMNWYKCNILRRGADKSDPQASCLLLHQGFFRLRLPLNVDIATDFPHCSMHS